MRRLLAAIGCFVLAALILPWAAVGCTMGDCPMGAPAAPCGIDTAMPCCQSVAPAPPLPAATTTVAVAVVAGDSAAAILTPSVAPAERPALALLRGERRGGERQALLSIFRI